MKLKCDLLFTAALAVSAQAPAQSLDSVFKANSSSLLNVAAAVVLAKVLGVDVNIVLHDSASYGISCYDEGPVWYIAHECGRPVPSVWELRRKRMGWGQIAHQLGMHPGAFNKMRKKGDFDRFWPVVASDCGLTSDAWNGFHKKGLGDRDIIVAIGISGGNGNKAAPVISKRRSTGYWDVPGRGKVKGSDIKSPHSQGNGNSKSGLGRTSEHHGGQGHGKGNTGHSGGNEKGHGNSNNNGHGNSGHGRGNGHGQGKGQG